MKDRDDSDKERKKTKKEAEKKMEKVKEKGGASRTGVPCD